MRSVPRRAIRRKLLLNFLLITLPILMPRAVAAQSETQRLKQAIAEGAPSCGDWSLEADQQSKKGNVYYADGNVDVKCGEARLRADHIEYDSVAQTIMARGHVQLDYSTQHVDANEANYDLRTGAGRFQHVRATFAIQRRPTPTMLLSQNPLYFEAEEAERLDQNTYRIRNAWMTVCNPARPTWTFYAPDATVRLEQSVHLSNGNFRVFSVPVLYFPYATLPVETRRGSGFLIPEIGNSSRRGLVLGDAFYWAPLDWLDVRLGAAYFSRRGWAQSGELRMRPWEGGSLDANYFGVLDRGLEQPSGPPVNQGGHEEHVLFTSPVPRGWRAVADLDQLSSLTFRLAFSETFSEAVNSEVSNTAFLTKSLNGFNVDFAASSYQNYLSATPQTSVTLRSAPVAHFSSLERTLFPSLPLYFSFDAFSGAVYRNNDTPTPFSTPGFVGRSEVAPTLTLPLHWGPWLNVTPSFTVRSTHYGGQMANGSFASQGFFRNTAEAIVDVRPPALVREWSTGNVTWRHAIEPEITYQYVTGVDNFTRFVRYDADETLTDTNDVEYGITQRLFRRTSDSDSQEVVSWRLAQQYYFNPTFGGAFVQGQRNVFQALDYLTPFAFDDTLHRFSPIVSDLRFTTSSRYDTQFRVDFDPVRGQATAFGTLLKIRPYRESSLTLAHFDTIALPGNAASPPPNFQPRSNQVRALLGYGETNRRGWNANVGASYDVSQQTFQNQLLQVSYNTNCCGIGVEYRRFSFGTIRNENQFRFVFLIANLGSVGNLRRQEKIFN